MKWFKHQAAARNDERIARLEDKAGLEGYGFYFKMLEIVAEVIDSSDRCDVTYSMSRWGRQTNVSTKKCLFLLQCCADVGLMIVQRVGDDMVVKIPNLLKYRDNHTKNLQVTSKQEVEVEVEVEEKQKEKKEKAKTASPSPLEILISIGVDEQAAKDWLTVRKAKRAPFTETALNDLKLEAGKAGITIGQAVAICAKKNWQGFNSTWNWNDDKPANKHTALVDSNRAAINEWLKTSERVVS